MPALSITADIVIYWQLRHKLQLYLKLIFLLLLLLQAPKVMPHAHVKSGEHDIRAHIDTRGTLKN